MTTTKTRQYLVYRVGSNAANQSRTLAPKPIAIVEAENRTAAASTSWQGRKPSIDDCPSLAAKIVASGGNLDVWSNQHVYAVPRSAAKMSDWNAVLQTPQAVY